MTQKPADRRTNIDTYPLEGAISRVVDKFAHIAMLIVVDVVAVIVGIAMLWVVVTLGRSLIEVFSGGGMEALLGMVEGALTIFIFIEIFESFLTYMREKTVSVVLMLDLSLIIVLREVWLTALDHPDGLTMLAFAALVLAIGVVRVAMSVTKTRGRGQDATEAR